jgi:hypothetical protein
MLPSALLVHLTSSFLISTLRLIIEPERNATQSASSHSVQTPLLLISPHQNLSIAVRGGRQVLADWLPVAELSTIASQVSFEVGGFGMEDVESA